jgi:FkbM family methyltransferase
MVLRSLLTITNRQIGAILSKFGYAVDRKYRRPRCTLSVVDLAIHTLLAAQQEVVVMQIGAFDGVTSDPVGRWVGHPRFSVVLVEPQPAAFAILSQRFGHIPRTRLVEAAITESEGRASLFIPVERVSSQVASLSQEHVSRLLGPTTTISVRGMNVKTLLEETATTRVDLLQIDTEGFDFKILEQFFANGIEPLVINLESFHLCEAERNQLYVSLQSRGYTYLDHSLDTVAVKSELLQSSFSSSFMFVPS